MKKNIAIIGSGFSSLSASCYLAKEGHNVSIYEKNDFIGGRARQFKKDGFTFDMGPSWYWMPDIFEKFFSDFGKSPSNYYELEKLSPAYKVFFSDDQVVIEDHLDKICVEFERIEKGSAIKLRKFIKKAQRNYDIAINKMVYKPGISPIELVSSDTVLRVNEFFKSISKSIRKLFKNPKLIAVLEFPVLFLGAKPQQTPSFYSFMNFADFGLGTWHPKGGMHQVISAMQKLAKELGVVINANSSVSKIHVQNKKTTGITCNDAFISADIVLSGADYHHAETLLDNQYKQYSESYWSKKTFAPSSLLFYVGFNKKIEKVEHHNLFFDTNFENHVNTIYDKPQWPKSPLFYANFPSISDETMAPSGYETGFFLIPIAPDLEDTSELREKYFNILINRLEEKTGQSLKNNILFKESFCVNDFKSEYNSYKGNAYGMANTLSQTAFLRPKLKSSKVKNLFFTGQLTVPGPGVPPALISGKLASELIINTLR